MVVVGFHSHWLNGIDYMGQNYSKGVMNLFFSFIFFYALLKGFISEINVLSICDSVQYS